MNKKFIKKLLQLSSKEKLKLVDALWDSHASVPKLENLPGPIKMTHFKRTSAKECK